MLLKRIEVRVVAILESCSVKVPKPRPDGSVGEKWAILGLDDGTGQADAMCYANPWKKFNQPDPSKPALIEPCVDQLVLVCGEVTHRTNYDKDDLVKANPQVGDVSFSVKEVYPLEKALPLVSKGVKLRLRYEDPDLLKKVEAVRDAAQKNPGPTPVGATLRYRDGTVLTVDFGPLCQTAVNIGFLSLLAKAVPQNDVDFHPEDKMTLAPREPKPWER